MTSSSPGLTSIKYPKQLETSSADYVIFTHSEYRTNRAVRGGRVGPDTTRLAGPPAEAGSSSILLYMPTTTPPTNTSNDWGAVRFDGPLGVMLSDLANGAVTSVDGISNDVFSTPESAKEGGKKVGREFANQFKGVKNNMGGASKQWLINRIASTQPGDPNQLMALNNGEIFNPNVEMLYKGPQVRSFTFAFTLSPKSQEEALIVNRIVREFKIWSAPSNANNDGMYKIPHIWQVRYESAGNANANMNIFKQAALTAVNTQANPGLPMHVAFDNGMPVTTSLSLNFTEVDVITREDQQDAPNNVGF